MLSAARTLFFLAWATISTALFAQAAKDRPPLELATNIREAALPAPPPGFVWQRIDELQAAIATPSDWKTYGGRSDYMRLAGFSPRPLDAKGRFALGVTARMHWHPEAAPGQEEVAADALIGTILNAVRSNEAENRVLTSLLEERGARKILTLRYRSAPRDAEPHIVHTIAVADANTGLVYEFSFEAPEAEWEEQWKTGEQILRRSVVLFQRG